MSAVSQPQTDQSAGEALARTESIVDSDSSPMNYGSCMSEKTQNMEEVFLENLDTYGGPKALLITAWGSLVPIIVPLVAIMQSNMKSAFEHSCSSHPLWSASRTVCEISFVGVLMFPISSLLAAIGLVTWRLARQRLFYVFLRQRIFLNLVNETSFKKVILQTQGFLFMLALVHFGVALRYANHRAAGVRVQGDHPLCPGTFAQTLRHPEILMEDPAFRHCTEYMALWVTKFIVPSLIAIFFTNDIDDAEANLIPCSKLYDVDPVYVHKRLAESIGVGEDVARDIVDSDDFDHNVTDKDVSKVCEHFRITALSFEGVCRIGGQEDEENANVPLKKGTGEVNTLWGVASRPWWPLRVILKDDMSEFREAMSFRKAWCGHCLVCFLFLGVSFVIRQVGCYKMVSAVMYDSKAKSGWSGVGLIFVLTCVVTVVQAMALYSLLKSAWSHWH